MNKMMLIAVLAFLMVGCSTNAPTHKPRPAEPFIILTSGVDPAANRLMISIRVDPPITEANVRQAAELVIEKNKPSYKSITVKSFATSDASGFPYATSFYDGQMVTHQFNPQAAPQKIPSH
jgi:hypothetical protein